MKRIVVGALALIVLGLAPRFATPQLNHGGGISSIGLGNGVDAELVREHWGPPDSVRLVAAVLFRGQPMWGLTRNGAETERARAMMDSAWKDASQRHAWGGGSVTPSANAWIEFNPATRILKAQEQEWSALSRDSILVILVDRVDHVGGEPTVSTISVFGPPDIDVTRLPGADLMTASKTQSRTWQAVLMADPRIHDFVQGRPSLPPS